MDVGIGMYIICFSSEIKAHAHRHELWPGPLWADTLARLAVVLLTIWLAQRITDSIGDTEKRTTNYMPYPANMSEEEKQRVKSR